MSVKIGKGEVKIECNDAAVAQLKLHRRVHCCLVGGRYECDLHEEVVEAFLSVLTLRHEFEASRG